MATTAPFRFPSDRPSGTRIRRRRTTPERCRRWGSSHRRCPVAGVTPAICSTSTVPYHSTSAAVEHHRSAVGGRRASSTGRPPRVTSSRRSHAQSRLCVIASRPASFRSLGQDYRLAAEIASGDGPEPAEGVSSLAGFRSPTQPVCGQLPHPTSVAELQLASQPDDRRVVELATTHAAVLLLHGLRHTWATLALRAGVHPKVERERLGHSTIGITLNTYSHVSVGMQRDAAEKVAGLIFRT